MRIVLSDILRRDESIEIVATAANGFDGVSKARVLLPDVIVTDMAMPGYDGLYVVQQLMKERPIPIILLSALDRSDQKVFDALEEGAFDFICKPDQHEVAAGYGILTSMVREASVNGYKRREKLRGKRNLLHEYGPTVQYDIVVIGASTGGPGAVELIVNNLPVNLPVPVVIAQHMPERFIETFADRLKSNAGFSVTVAMHGEQLEPNHIYLASGEGNMRINVNDDMPSVNYVKDVYPEFNNPSIDCLFESVSTQFAGRAIGVLLTGMGKDGAKGLKKIKESGGLTITQDEASSVVYGMPKVAFESGASCHHIPLSEIPNFIITAL